MRSATVAAGFGLLLLASSAAAQVAPVGQPSNVGSWRAPSINPGTGSGDIPASSLPSSGKAGVLDSIYGVDLLRRIAEAQKLVDQVNQGRVLTDSDTRRIRNQLREDFISWNKQFDLTPASYRSERDRWLVEPQQLSPAKWAQQRLDWLEAQRDWMLKGSRH